MGVDTHLYLIDKKSCHEVAVPALSALLEGRNEPARKLFERACAALAEQRREYPWGPIHHWEGQLEFGLNVIDGSAKDLHDPDPRRNRSGIDPAPPSSRLRVRRSGRGPICTPEFPFLPIHCVTCDGSVWELYQASQKLEFVFTGEITSETTQRPKATSC